MTAASGVSWAAAGSTRKRSAARRIVFTDGSILVTRYVRRFRRRVSMENAGEGLDRGDTFR